MRRPALLAAALVMVMVVGGSAWATPLLTLRSGATVVNVSDGSLLDASNLDAGVVTYIGRIGNWCINITTGASGVGGTGVPELDLNSIDYSSSGPGNLVITLTDTVTGAWSGNGAVASVGGTFNATGDSTADFKTLIDGQLVSELTFSSKSTGPSFSGSDPFEFRPHDSDTVQLVADITHRGKGSTSFDYAIAPVPEPSTLVLAGAGAVGVALLTRRRRKI